MTYEQMRKKVAKLVSETRENVLDSAEIFMSDHKQYPILEKKLNKIFDVFEKRTMERIDNIEKEQLAEK